MLKLRYFIFLVNTEYTWVHLCTESEKMFREEVWLTCQVEQKKDDGNHRRALYLSRLLSCFTCCGGLGGEALSPLRPVCQSLCTVSLCCRLVLDWMKIYSHDLHALQFLFNFVCVHEIKFIGDAVNHRTETTTSAPCS